MNEEWNLSEEEWLKRLSKEKHLVLRLKGTEPPFSGEYYDHKQEGTYHCAACNLPLFSSETKFDSGSGWPSFWNPIDPNHLSLKEDHKLASPRTEALCNRCHSHLGHVFDDGPLPTGKRYCINSLALQFHKKL